MEIFRIEEPEADLGLLQTTSKMEYFVITVNSWRPLTTITKSSILDVAAVLDPPLETLDLNLFWKGKLIRKR